MAVSQEKDSQPNDPSEFEQLGEEKQMSLMKELRIFIVENKAWWMIPIVIVFGLVGLLAILGSP